MRQGLSAAKPQSLRPSRTRPAATTTASRLPSAPIAGRPSAWHSESECESEREALPSGEIVTHCDVFHVREVEIGRCRLDEWTIGPFRSAWSGQCPCPFSVLADSAGEARYELIEIHVEASVLTLPYGVARLAFNCEPAGPGARS